LTVLDAAGGGVPSMVPMVAERTRVSTAAASSRSS